MTDREKVISGLEISIISDTDAGFSTIEIPVQQAENILALLKEQEEQIKNRDESHEKAREEIKWLRGMLKERNDNFDLYDTPIFGFHD